MKILSLLFLIIIFTSSLYAEPIPGKYSDNTLLIGVDKKENTVSGYYHNYSGWDESSNQPRFSCIFYLKGTLTSGNTYKIKTWYPGNNSPEEMISGSLVVSDDNKSVSFQLDEEHGGCMNVELFADNNNPGFKLKEQKDWIDIRVVASSKMYFYKNMNNASKRRAYVVKRDILKILKNNKSWSYAEYENSKGGITKGWVKSIKFYSNEPPK